jgi:hypothetical protein
LSDAISDALDDDLDSSVGEESGQFPKGDTGPRDAGPRAAAPRDARPGGSGGSAPDADEVEIINHTARRIRIDRRGGEGLVLGPFGLVRVRRALLAELELGLWLERGYVIMGEPRRSEQPPVESTTIAGALAIVGLTILIQAVVERSWLPTIVGALLLVWTIAPELTRWREWLSRADASPLSAVMARARDRFWHALGMLVVCLTGFGLPIGVVFIQSGIALADLKAQPLRALGFLALFSCFIGSAATLPAMLFFLFAEQRRDVMRAQFHRDILRLDPALRTIGETERAYAPLLAEALCVRRGPLFFGPIVLSTFLLALGWVVSVLPKHADVQRALAPLKASAEAGASLPIELWALFVPNPTAFTFAFLGTYFFALNMVFRRYVRADLGPKAYSHVAVRIIIASVLAWVVSQTWEGLGDSPAASDGVSSWQLLLLAFFIGFVPDTGLTLLYGVLKSRWVSALIPALENRDPLTQLEGITLYDQARLLEEGIENIENLCHHNLIELLLRTRIPAPRLVDLVDQGILYLHARDDAPSDTSAKDGSSPAAKDGAASLILRKLKSLGIRTATDFEQAFRHTTSRAALLGRFGADAPRLELIAFALEDDEWMPQLRSWREFRRTYDTLYTAADLEQTGAQRRAASIAPRPTPNDLRPPAA